MKIAALTAVVALSACVSSAPPPPPPPPKVEPTIIADPAPPTRPAAAPVGDWRDWPITPGDWVYRQDARGSVALFGEPGQDAQFIIRCDASRRQIFLSRAGVAPANAKMVLRASTGLKEFSAGNTGGQLPYAASELNPRDDILDRIAFSRGRFVVDVTGTTPLAIPIYPEFTRVVEDCR